MDRCPKCNSQQLSAENPYGRYLCEDCGWLSHDSAFGVSLREYLHPIARWLFISLMITFFVTLFIQLILWKQFSFQATFLQVKALFYIDKKNSNLELGAICNSLEEYSCARRYFNKVVEEDPSHKPALANLAMAYAQQNLWKTARPIFEAYFSLGGNAYDVVFWYGKTLYQLEGRERGLEWYYYSLKINPNFYQAAKELVDDLIREKQFDEALGLIAAVTRGQPNNFPRWKKLLDSATFLKREKNIQKKVEWRLPSLDGVYYYLPIILKTNGRIQFFRIDDKHKYNFISIEALDEHLIATPEHVVERTLVMNKEAIAVKTFKLPEVQIGSWMNLNMELNACRGCPISLGTDFLKTFEVEKWSTMKVNYMTLKSRH